MGVQFWVCHSLIIFEAVTGTCRVEKKRMRMVATREEDIPVQGQRIPVKSSL